jgi:hypothetical protein
VVVDPAGHPAADLLRARENWLLTDADQDGG